jgi:hypothetical protein
VWACREWKEAGQYMQNAWEGFESNNCHPGWDLVVEQPFNPTQYQIDLMATLYQSAGECQDDFLHSTSA